MTDEEPISVTAWHWVSMPKQQNHQLPLWTRVPQKLQLDLQSELKAWNVFGTEMNHSISTQVVRFCWGIFFWSHQSLGIQSSISSD